MDRLRLKIVAIAALLTVILVGGSLFVLAKLTAPSPTPAPPSAVQPKIRWSTASIEPILFPGERTSRDVTFTSTANLQNAVLEAVPTISKFVSLQPANLASVPASQPQPVHILFTIPAGTALGTYSGTIHLRLGSQTVPQTLNVIINIWKLLSIDQFGVSVNVPPTLQVDAYQPLGPLGRGQGETLAMFRSVAVRTPGTDAPVPGCFISLSVEDNSDGFSLANWLVQRSYRRPNDVDSEVSVNGTTGILRTGSGEVFGNPFAALFVSHGIFVFELSSNTYGTSGCSQAFNNIVSTLQFGG